MDATDGHPHHDLSQRPGWLFVRRATAPTTAAQAELVPLPHVDTRTNFPYPLAVSVWPLCPLGRCVR